MGDWDNDWENTAVTITKADNTFAKEDTIDTEAVERQAKEDAKKKQEEENKKKKEEEEAAKKKNKKVSGGKKIQFNDQFNLPDTSSKLTKLKEKKFQKESINEMFDGANHEFNDYLDQIHLDEAEDFRILGSLLGNKMCDPDYYLIHVEDFFKNLLDATYEKLTSKEIQEISSKVTALLQKKQKDEKGGLKKNKAKVTATIAAKNAATLAAGSDHSQSDSGDEYAYKANFNEDDFI